ncbi:MAG: PIN domain-containing protein [Oscillospiraceae bacterium]|nr:PIN domain-containing protein [Oscillospiraceae bacterium]
MSGGKAFIDTNIFVYLYSDTDISKRLSVMQEIDKYERFISTQVLNEFSNVCIRKLKLPLADVRNAITEICNTCNLVIIDDNTVMDALQHHEKYGYSYYDSLIIATALESGCEYLLSEDMSDGQIIEDALTIKNIV